MFTWPENYATVSLATGAVASLSVSPGFNVGQRDMGVATKPCGLICFSCYDTGKT
ncbi:hypothetical protein HanRHA438_Chr12g0573891 [Helianthus annuus]|nr:hypothetical protein HanRHA438_Chr12g0573891 [Helianthus annuus]